MPAVMIETRCPRSQLDEVEVMEAVHQAVVHAFQIPNKDRNVRLITHEPHRFACPPHLEEPNLFTLITIDAFAGRSLDAKRLLYKTIVDSLAALGIPKGHVTIVLRDIPTTNFGIRGGQAACDVDLEFKIAV